MFVGQRKYESIKRFKQPRVWKNPWVPNETGASPIFHWRALEVWLYIFSRGLPYNPLYEDRLDRIGCFLCRAHPGRDLHAEGGKTRAVGEVGEGTQGLAEALRDAGGMDNLRFLALEGAEQG